MDDSETFNHANRDSESSEEEDEEVEDHRNKLGFNTNMDDFLKNLVNNRGSSFHGFADPTTGLMSHRAPSGNYLANSHNSYKTP